MNRNRVGKSPYFPDPMSSPQISPLAGLRTLLLTGLDKQKMMMVLSSTLPGCTVPTHSHPQEQIGMVYSGRAVLWIGEEKRSVSKGDFYCIPAGVPHGDTCIGDKPFVMLDVFYPIRKDFVARTELTAKSAPASSDERERH
jgi:unsaturated pyranuronate lyase